MNLGINSYSNNYGAMNCKRKNSPNFGMAFKVEDSAMKVIKDQVLSLKPKKAEGFWQKFNDIITRNESNPVNVIIRKCEKRNALAAEVVDSEAATAINNKVYTQPFFFKNGNLAFAERAEADAKVLNETNAKLAELPKAAEKDFYPGGIIPEAEANA